MLAKMRDVAIPGAGTTAADFNTDTNPPSGARVSGQITLIQGNYLYSAIGQQSVAAQINPGKPNPPSRRACCQYVV